MKYGFIITANGWSVLSRVISGDKILKLAGVVFGKGRCEDNENPATFTQLKEPVADGSTSNVFVENSYNEDGSVSQATISFIAEYNSSGVATSITGIPGSQIDEDFFINEFGVYALDPDTQEPVLIYYATLGDTPHPVTSFSKGAIDIRRYPVSIALSENMSVQLIYPPLAFVTTEEMNRYAQEVCKPVFLDLVKEMIQEHDADLNAHKGLRKLVDSNDERISVLERLFAGESHQFRYDFLSLEGLVLSAGVHNTAEGIVQF